MSTGEFPSPEVSFTAECADMDFSKKRAFRLPRLATKILRQWYAGHAAHPYPTEEQKEMLKAQTNLNARQVSNWFANARRRYTARSFENSATSSGYSVSVPDLTRAARWQDMNPLDRWRHSPPDQEPAPLDAIAVAVENSRRDHAGNAKRLSDPFVAPRHPYRTHSNNSFDDLSAIGTSQSSNSTGSSFSIESGESNSGIHRFRHTKPRRRRRHLDKHLQASPVHPRRGHKERKYQCTFCTDTFYSKYDWTRHESTLHLPLEKWICCPEGPTYLDQVPHCSFCGAENPTALHIQSHHYDECAVKPVPLRTFGRKDHLTQHLRLVHRVHAIPDHIANWRSKITSLSCRCGFCGERFFDWSARNDHIAEHFCDGASMKEWTGCRGLDPEVALLVENAIPPYLIHSARNDFEPFSASTNPNQNPGAGQRLPTTFELLTARLGDLVLQAIKDGAVVTDETVRKQARMIMYGDDDAWNQTPADNAEWLRLFKQGVRLKSVANPFSTQTDTRSAFRGSEVTGGQNAQFGQSNPCSGAPLDPVSPPGCAPLQIEGASMNTDLLSPYASDNLTNLPLCWQTPECLAEFSQMSSTNSDAMTCGKDVGHGSSNPANPSIPSPVDAQRIVPAAAEYGYSGHRDELPAHENESSSCLFSQWTNADDFIFSLDLNQSESSI